MRKKILSFAMAVLLLISFIVPMFAYADAVASIKVEDVTGKAGDTVIMEVSLENLPESSVWGATFELTYDDSILELQSVDELVEEGILSDGGKGNGDITASPYIMSYGDGMKPINSASSGLIATITFAIKDTAKAGDTADVTVTRSSLLNESLDEIALTEESVVGTVKVPGAHTHELDEWEVVTAATCTETGLRERRCISLDCDTPGGYVEQEIIEKIPHVLSDWTVTEEPTCTETGLRVKTCSICEEVIVTETLDPLGHDPVTEIITVATCSGPGESRQVCSVCGEVLEENIVIPAKEHILGDWVVVKKPTCTEDGGRVRRCTECEEVIQSEIITAPGHSFGEWETVKAATVAEEGEEQRTCSVCGEIEKRSVPKITHEESDHIFDGEEEVVKEATCTEGGLKRIHCSIESCDQYVEESIPATGHQFGEWETTKEATCTESGEQTRSCEICGEKETRTIAPIGHQFGEWEITVEPTCTENGEEVRICAICGEQELEQVAAVGHSPGEWEIVKEATCQESGIQERLCTTCGISLEMVVLDKTDHQYGEWKVTKEATCTSEGEQGAECVICGETIKEEIPMTEHNVGEAVISKEATCTEAGERQYICDICNDVITTEEIPATGHNFGELVVVKEASCTESGQGKQVCANCGVERYTTLEAIGHSYGESVVTKEATFNEDGEAKRVCERCGDVLLSTIPKLSESHEHDFHGKTEVIKEATCTENGEERNYCVNADCGAYQTVITAAKGHNYGEWKTIKEATMDKEGLRQRTCSICGDVQEENIEKLKNADTAAPVSVSPVDQGNNVKATNAVKTGDETPLVKWIMILVISGIVVCGTPIAIRRFRTR